MANPTLAEYNAIIAHCGCCETPRCCPPLLECQSGFARVQFTGFIRPEDVSDSGSSGWFPMPTRYAKKTQSLTEGDSSTDSAHPDGGTFVSQTVAGSGYYNYVMEYPSLLEVSIAGPYFSGSCYAETPTAAVTCEYGGTRTQEDFGLSREDSTWVRYLAVRQVDTYSSGAGDETLAHIAWEIEAAAWDLEHPDYETEHAAWQAAYDTWNAWFEAREAWVAEDPENRTPEEYPEPDPGEPGPEPPPRPEEPEEFYPPCTMKRSRTITAWQREVVDGTWTSVLVDPGDLGQDTNPYTIIEYSTTPQAGEEWYTGNLLGAPTTQSTTYELPMTHAEFQAAAEDWITDNIHRIYDAADISGIDSSSPACEPGDLCVARREFSQDNTTDPTPTDYRAEDFFRYRFKLNKCCGYKYILSAWKEVFFPQDYLDWYAGLAYLGSTEEATPAPADIEALAESKQWLWEGDPPLCPENLDSASSNDTDPYDYEPMWSPWSLVVRVPTGEQGMTVLRNYLQYCGYPLADLMPDVTGVIDFSDSLPDGP